MDTGSSASSSQQQQGADSVDGVPRGARWQQGRQGYRLEPGWRLEPGCRVEQLEEEGEEQEEASGGGGGVEMGCRVEEEEEQQQQQLEEEAAGIASCSISHEGPGGRSKGGSGGGAAEGERGRGSTFQGDVIGCTPFAFLPESRTAGSLEEESGRTHSWGAEDRTLDASETSLGASGRTRESSRGGGSDEDCSGTASGTGASDTGSSSSSNGGDGLTQHDASETNASDTGSSSSSGDGLTRDNDEGSISLQSATRNSAFTFGYEEDLPDLPLDPAPRNIMQRAASGLRIVELTGSSEEVTASGSGGGSTGSAGSTGSTDSAAADNDDDNDAEGTWDGSSGETSSGGGSETEDSTGEGSLSVTISREGSFEGSSGGGSTAPPSSSAEVSTTADDELCIDCAAGSAHQPALAVPAPPYTSNHRRRKSSRAADDDADRGALVPFSSPPPRRKSRGRAPMQPPDAEVAAGAGGRKAGRRRDVVRAGGGGTGTAVKWPYILYISMEAVPGVTLDVWLKKRAHTMLPAPRAHSPAHMAPSGLDGPSATPYTAIRGGAACAPSANDGPAVGGGGGGGGRLALCGMERAIFRQIVLGLLHCHSAGIIHRGECKCGGEGSRVRHCPDGPQQGWQQMGEGGALPRAKAPKQKREALSALPSPHPSCTSEPCSPSLRSKALQHLRYRQRCTGRGAAAQPTPLLRQAGGLWAGCGGSGGGRRGGGGGLRRLLAALLVLLFRSLYRLHPHRRPASTRQAAHVR